MSCQHHHHLQKNVNVKVSHENKKHTIMYLPWTMIFGGSGLKFEHFLAMTTSLQNDIILSKTILCSKESFLAFSFI